MLLPSCHYTFSDVVAASSTMLPGGPGKHYVWCNGIYLQGQELYYAPYYLVHVRSFRRLYLRR